MTSYVSYICTDCGRSIADVAEGTPSRICKHCGSEHLEYNGTLHISNKDYILVTHSENDRGELYPERAFPTKKEAEKHIRNRPEITGYMDIPYYETATEINHE